MSTVLVTGASGFTGRYVVAALKELGHRVVGLGSKESGADKTVACDLTDPKLVDSVVREERPSKVIHLAALSYVGHGDAESFYKVNIIGTTNLLSALEKSDCPIDKVVIASSANVYGTPKQSVIDESVCPAPVNHYACSKLAMEHMALTWCDRLPIVIVRPFNYTGIGQDERFLIPKMVGHFARRERVIELGNLDVSRDFTAVDDVVRAYLGLLLSPRANGEIVNVCSGSAHSLLQVLEWLKELSGHDIDICINPAFVRKNEISVLKGSYNKLSELIDWKPTVSLRNLIKGMLKHSENS